MINYYKKLSWGLLAALIVLTVLFPTLQNGWTSWDDQAYILDNPLVKQLNWKSVKAIFSTLSFNGGYTPLPMLSWALNRWFSGTDAFPFHLTNLLLHLLNVLLCHWLVWRLTKNGFTAFMVALLFGIHPMNLEPVAWITGRKDLLLGLFSLSSLVTWSYFLDSQTKCWKWYFITIVLFALALLSKGTAVVIPVWMVLVLLFKQGKFGLRELYVHIPFFGISLVFGLLAIWSQQTSKALSSFSDIAFSESLLWTIQALGTYVSKLFFPYHIGPFHGYPLQHSVFLIAIGLLSVCLVGTSLIFTRQLKLNLFVFGALFFLVGIIPVLQFLPVGFALTADRYAYMPFIGGYLIMAQLMRFTESHTVVIKTVKATVLVAFTCLFAYQTRQHAHVWKSDLDLWSHEIEYHNHIPRAYVNRGQYYLSRGEYEKSIEDLHMAILQEPDMKEAYQQQGLAFQGVAKYDEAALSFKKAIVIDSSYVPAWLNLSLNYFYVGDTKLALHNLETAEDIEPFNMLVLLNLGILHEQQGNVQFADSKYTKAIEFHPLASKGYRYRGVLRFQQRNYQAAKMDFEHWRERDSQNPMVYRWLARTSASLGVKDAFYINTARASELSGPLPQEEFKHLEALLLEN